MEPLPRPDRALALLKWALYTLAVLVFVAGLVGAISLFNARFAMNGLVPVLSAFAPGPLVNIVSGFIVQAASTLGVAVLLIALVIALPLFACGKLIARITSLTQRVALLEAKQALGPRAE